MPIGLKTQIKEGLSRRFFLANRVMKTRTHDYKKYALDIFDVGKKGSEFVEYRDNEVVFTEEDIKPIAFYLPQFYTFPENDEWWGKGFTEWTNVTKAVPQFVGHYQPRLPQDMPFYDLSNIDTVKNQVSLAKNYGIFGFCFHYYWFNGKRMLEKPLDAFLEAKDIDFRFCLNWANENWTRRWDGAEQEILIAQKHSDEDDLACIADICRYIRDKRYIRVEGKPLIIIYRADILPDVSKTIKIWRTYCRDNDIGEICIAAIRTFHLENPYVYDFDEVVEFPPHFVSRDTSNISTSVKAINPEFNNNIFDMDYYISSRAYFNKPLPKIFKGIFPDWDNTPRRGSNATIYPMTSTLYKQWLLDIMEYTKKNRLPDDRFVFINAWNEWAEGAYLEPDRRNGYSALQDTLEAVLETRSL